MERILDDSDCRRRKSCAGGKFREPRINREGWKAAFLITNSFSKVVLSSLHPNTNYINRGRDTKNRWIFFFTCLSFFFLFTLSKQN